ncbi:hypothetical protein GGTG_03286 [Gaeumannomyces tritici R3-111a-1]|uniref:Uncharacterized protein n=1 Tax=Gaeumannomyces tritici (strain R3-111a-1) TaxID=644352 RepID=J3NPS9_GAET3|nr:hypothetical protein GGTG_03286 [Gaeumannomyces tritici R3-111a-1]EJT78184.1 hypothetical protein GGTG_03286 [Gaeumannomyces tritici R3-111a-1]
MHPRRFSKSLGVVGLEKSRLGCQEEGRKSRAQPEKYADRYGATAGKRRAEGMPPRLLLQRAKRLGEPPQAQLQPGVERAQPSASGSKKVFFRP